MRLKRGLFERLFVKCSLFPLVFKISSLILILSDSFASLKTASKHYKNINKHSMKNTVVGA